MTLKKTPERSVAKAELSRSTPRSIRGIIPDGRSTRPSGGMTLQIGWRHGGANWHRRSFGFLLVQFVTACHTRRSVVLVDARSIAALVS